MATKNKDLLCRTISIAEIYQIDGLTKTSLVPFKISLFNAAIGLFCSTMEKSGFFNKEREMATVAPDIKKTATNYFLRREVLIDLINPRKQTVIYLNIAV